jgi:uncharacterized RDD family membrane protein YckC
MSGNLTISNCEPMPRRRLLAFSVDYLLVLAWMALLASIGFIVRRTLHFQLNTLETARHKWFGHTVSFTSLTLPVVAYFAVGEGSRWHATPGKRAFGIRVESWAGGPISMRRSVLRSALKFIPWEIAHTILWHSPGQPFVSEPDLWGKVGYAAAIGGASLYIVSLLVLDGRTPYDRLAKTCVRRSDAC